MVFERTSKRRRGYPSETQVKRGPRGVQTPMGKKEFLEKLGRSDLCPCGSGKRFQAVLPAIGSLLMDPTETTTCANSD
ncbi:MAG: SEC-C domain-containing protein [Planctomycetes bacterium]|nr:SEC-C domain-containing protein [Planctomycetota bacterium]